MKTLLWIFWPLKRGESWRDRLKMLVLFLLLVGGWAAIAVGAWLIDGK